VQFIKNKTPVKIKFTGVNNFFGSGGTLPHMEGYEPNELMFFLVAGAAL